MGERNAAGKSRVAVQRPWTTHRGSGTIGTTMLDDMQARFSAGAEDWSRYHREPPGFIRHEVTWRNLAPHLPTVSSAENLPRVLDVGAGSGEMAVRLVPRGFRRQSHSVGDGSKLGRARSTATIDQGIDIPGKGVRPVWLFLVEPHPVWADCYAEKPCACKRVRTVLNRRWGR